MMDRESSKSNVGRPKKEELRDEILDLLSETEYRVMTLGMIDDEVENGSRPTVKDRLDNLVDDGEVEYQKIGNAKGYFIPETNNNAGKYFTQITDFCRGLFVGLRRS